MGVILIEGNGQPDKGCEIQAINFVINATGSFSPPDEEKQDAK